jgi:hypothetical protein
MVEMETARERETGLVKINKQSLKLLLERNKGGMGKEGKVQSVKSFFSNNPGPVAVGDEGELLGQQQRRRLVSVALSLLVVTRPAAASLSPRHFLSSCPFSNATTSTGKRRNSI